MTTEISLNLKENVTARMTEPFGDFWDDDHATSQVLWLPNPRFDPLLNLFCDQTLRGDVFCGVSQNDICSGKLLPFELHADNPSICDVWVCDQETFQFRRRHLESLESRTQSRPSDKIAYADAHIVLDQFLLPIHNPEESLLIPPGNIPRLQPPIICDSVSRGECVV